MIGHGREPEAPDDVVVRLGTINRQFTIGGVTRAFRGSLRAAFAAAVAIRDQIRLAVLWIDASADPRGRRWLCARRAGVHTATDASAKRSIDSAVAPVGADVRIFRLGAAHEIGLCSPV